MIESNKYQVKTFWDAEAEVWVATSENVPGLATEAETLDMLSDKLRIMIPELLILNGVIAQNYKGDIAIELIDHHQEIISVIA